MNFNKWFETFLEEKNLPYAEWEIVGNDGRINFINSDVVIDYIKNTSQQAKDGIKSNIVDIDFINGDVNKFFEYLAGWIINI